MLRAKDVMTPFPVTVEAQTPLREAAALLLQHRWLVLPVVDGAGRLIGILSETDLLVLAESPHLLEQEAATSRFWALGSGQEAERHLQRARSRTVGEVMTPHPSVIAPDLPTDRIAEIMADQGVHLLPVVEGDTDRLLGVVTRTDLLRAWWEGRLS